MISALFKESSASQKIFFSGFIILLCFTIFMAIGIVFSHLLFNIDFDKLSGNLNPANPLNIPAMKFLQACFSIGLFVIPPFLIAYVIHGKIFEFLKLGSVPSFYLILLSVSLIVFSMPLVNYMALLNENIHFPAFMKEFETVFKNYESDAQKTTNAFLHVTTFGGLLINLVVVAFIPAIGEELLFRGVFQRLFHEWTKNIHFSIFLSSFIFSALHLQFYGTIPRLFLGMLFGYLFYWTKNLWLPMLAHFFNNAIAVILIYINDDAVDKINTAGTENESLPLVVFSLISIVIILYFIYRSGKEKHMVNSEINQETYDK